MAKIFAQGRVAWSRTATGYLSIKIGERYIDSVRTALRRLREYEDKKGPRNINLTIEIAYRARSLDQNALMWALLEVIANEHNAGVEDHAEPMRDSDFFYRLFLFRFAPREIRVNRDEPEIPRTSSTFDTREMADFINRIFDELAEMDIGVSDPGAIGAYWQKWKRGLSDTGVILHGHEMPVDQYRHLVKQCEACGRAVWHEDVGSSVAHIKAIGMGGPRSGIVRGSEVMHLCDPDHALYDNGKGREHFLETYPHLEYKIKRGLRLEVTA
jgi:hypothetical protein